LSGGTSNAIVDDRIDASRSRVKNPGNPLEKRSIYLKDYNALERASVSTPHQENWTAAGARRDEIEACEDLARTPFTTSQELPKRNMK